MPGRWRLCTLPQCCGPATASLQASLRVSSLAHCSPLVHSWSGTTEFLGEGWAYPLKVEALVDIQGDAAELGWVWLCVRAGATEMGGLPAVGSTDCPQTWARALP